MSTELGDAQPKESLESEAMLLLAPLKLGIPVVLSVKDKKIRRKKRIGIPMLFITPSSVYGLEPGSLVIGLQGGKCEVMKVEDIKLTYLYSMGLSMESARILKSEIIKLFQEQHIDKEA